MFIAAIILVQEYYFRHFCFTDNIFGAAVGSNHNIYAILVSYL